jgi:hypothetical protein
VVTNVVTSGVACALCTFADLLLVLSALAMLLLVLSALAYLTGNLFFFSGCQKFIFPVPLLCGILLCGNSYSISSCVRSLILHM